MNRCVWTYDEAHEAWDTACDEKHQFMVDGPRENKYKFCPYCGDSLFIRQKDQRRMVAVARVNA